MTSCQTLSNKPRPDGYVRTTRNGKAVYAHRYHYELVHGKIADGLEIDHLCDNRACINVEHLDAVTHKKNMSHARTRNLHTGFCRKGHNLSEAGIYVHPKTGPTCRQCKRDNLRKWRAKNETVQTSTK